MEATHNTNTGTKMETPTTIACHKMDAEAAETMADELSERFVVYVNRFGSGNGSHADLPGCGVYSIDVVRPL